MIMKDIGKILLGNLLISAAYAFITVPNNIINGGVTGLAQILSKLFGLDVAYMSNGITILLLLFSLFALGKAFFLKTILSSILYMGLFSALHMSGFAILLHPAIAAVLAGALVGFAYFCCIDANSSTAGFDVVAIAIHRKYPSRNIAVTMRYISIAILLIGCFSNGVEAVLYGILFTLVQTYVLNVLLAYRSKWHCRKVAASVSNET